MDYSKLPILNAALNTTNSVLLLMGFLFIRQRLIKAHTICMVGACVVSTLFLISYLTYHYNHGMTRFQGTGLIRWVYMTLLTSHTILAVTIVPLAIMTLFRGLSGNFPKHVKIARFTFPLWLYVSVTGVLIYFFLYHWYPSA